jgi:uncharacterized membrane protein YphA (DoxX/SURF4 family)
MDKLGASDRTQAVAIGLRRGIIQLWSANPHLPPSPKRGNKIFRIEGFRRLNLLRYFSSVAITEHLFGRLALQRLFSTFPGGRPGIGLLLLRVALGGIAITLGILYASGLTERHVIVWAGAVALIAGGVGLVIGFLTPLASLLVVLSLLGMTFSWLPDVPSSFSGERLMTLLLVATAIGIGLLGPGAFSMDGYLFGRREIIIPPRNPRSWGIPFSRFVWNYWPLHASDPARSLDR